MTQTLADFVAVKGHMPEKLLNYWVHGEGAAKIRWGTPGDFNRCVRNLRKYFPRNPEGLCNRLHTRALGVPPGQEHALTADAEGFLTPPLVTDGMDDDVLYEHEQGLFPTKKMWRGRLAPIGVPTGDRRRFQPGGISHRDLPLPLLYQLQTQEGHQQSVVVGRILGVEINDQEAYGYGDWLDSEHTAAAQHRMEQGIGGVSVDLDDLEYELRVPGTDTVWQAADQCSAEGECSVHEFVVTKGRIAAATLVAIPAFAEAKLEMYDGVDEEGLLQAFDEMPAVDDDSSCGCGMTAAAIEAHIPRAVTAAVVSFTPPASAFADPQFTGLQGIRLDDARYPGYVAIYGHMGDWNQRHMGLPGQSLPRSRTGYAYFHVGEVYTAEGDSLPVGKLLWGGSHPSMQAGMREAAQHYDDTSRGVALVRAGEDRFGIWLAGVLLPGVADDVKLGLMTSPPSGDWRPVGGNLEMIAALAVNVPGFPVVRGAQTAGRYTALVASAGPAPEAPPQPGVVSVQAGATLTWNGQQIGTIDAAVLQPYVDQQLADRKRREHAAAVQAQFVRAIEADMEKVRALYAPFTEGV